MYIYCAVLYGFTLYFRLHIGSLNSVILSHSHGKGQALLYSHIRSFSSGNNVILSFVNSHHFKHILVLSRYNSP